MVGKNIAQWLKDDKLPRTVSQFGSTVEEIFVTYETLKARFGAEIDQLPLGAIGWYTYVDKLKVGLQQLIAGSRNFRLSTISRKDVVALTREAADVTGISYVMDAYRDEARPSSTARRYIASPGPRHREAPPCRRGSLVAFATPAFVAARALPGV
jgi:hypothetical protein